MFFMNKFKKDLIKGYRDCLSDAHKVISERKRFPFEIKDKELIEDV